MFNLTASLAPLANLTLVQKLMPGMEAEGLKIGLAMTTLLNLAFLPLGLFLDYSPSPLILVQIPCNLVIQMALGFCSLSLASGSRYAIYWLWCQLGYKGECGSGACGDCLLKKNQNEQEKNQDEQEKNQDKQEKNQNEQEKNQDKQEKTKNTKERNEVCLCIKLNGACYE